MITVRTPARMLWVALLLSCAVTASSPQAAHAGTIAVVSCELPGGGPAPTEGWISGWTDAPLSYAGSSDSCASADGALGSYLGAQTAQPLDSGPFWEYTPPTGFSLIGGQLSAAFEVPGTASSAYSGAAGALGPKLQFDSADLIAGLPGGMSGSLDRTWSLAGHTGGHIWLYSLCGGPGGSCPADGSTAWYWSADYLKQAILLLANETEPTGSDFGGPLAAGSPLAGTQSFDFQAGDDASGVYLVTAAVDGRSVYSATPDPNGGACAAVGEFAGHPEFTSAEPCPRSASATIPIETAAFKDGEHELTITVRDAAGNETTVYSGQLETRNAPTAQAAPAITGAATVGGTLTGSNATFTAPPGAGALTAVSGQWMRCADAAATRCSPIAGATGLSYTPTGADAGYYLTFTDSASDTDGTTSVSSAPTPIVTASTALGSASRWSVTLRATPNHVHRGTTVSLSGAVTTIPRPAAGKLVYLRARSVVWVWRGRGRGRRRVARYSPWVTFQALRTAPDGTWRATYTFRLGGHHTYQMQAVAPQEGNYRNPTGTSSAQTIIET